MRTFEGYKKGINFGGWLSQCNYAKEHLDTFITKKDVEQVKAFGFDHVRIPFDYNIIQNEDGSFIEEGFKYLDNAVDWCLGAGINIILDLHKTQGYSFDAGEHQEGFFDSAKLQNNFYILWEEMAKRYSNHPGRVAFELLNEVTLKEYCDPWNKIMTKTIGIIRRYSKDVDILVGGYYNNSIVAIPDIDVPMDDHIIYNFHCYDPLIFTHQGAPWVVGMDTEFRLSVDSTFNEMAKATVENIDQPGVEFPSDMPEMDKPFDERYFIKAFKNSYDYAKSKGVPMYCGEYGVIDRATPQDTLKWFQYIGKAFKHYGIGSAIWSYKKMDFGFTDDRMDEVRDKIVEALS